MKDIVRGDTLRYRFTFTDNTGTEEVPVLAPSDITGWLLYFTLKLDEEDTDANAALQVFTTAGDNSGGVDYPDDLLGGILYLTVPSTATDPLVPGEKYQYDFQRVIPGTPPDVHTTERGSVKVLRDTTITT